MGELAKATTRATKLEVEFRREITRTGDDPRFPDQVRGAGQDRHADRPAEPPGAGRIFPQGPARRDGAGRSRSAPADRYRSLQALQRRVRPRRRRSGASPDGEGVARGRAGHRSAGAIWRRGADRHSAQRRPDDGCHDCGTHPALGRGMPHLPPLDRRSAARHHHFHRGGAVPGRRIHGRSDRALRPRALSGQEDRPQPGRHRDRTRGRARAAGDGLSDSASGRGDGPCRVVPQDWQCRKSAAIPSQMPFFAWGCFRDFVYPAPG